MNILIRIGLFLTPMIAGGFLLNGINNGIDCCPDKGFSIVLGNVAWNVILFQLLFGLIQFLLSLSDKATEKVENMKTNIQNLIGNGFLKWFVYFVGAILYAFNIAFITFSFPPLGSSLFEVVEQAQVKADECINKYCMEIKLVQTAKNKVGYGSRVTQSDVDLLEFDRVTNKTGIIIDTLYINENRRFVGNACYTRETNEMTKIDPSGPLMISVSHPNGWSDQVPANVRKREGDFVVLINSFSLPNTISQQSQLSSLNDLSNFK